MSAHIIVHLKNKTEIDLIVEDEIAENLLADIIYKSDIPDAMLRLAFRVGTENDVQEIKFRVGEVATTIVTHKTVYRRDTSGKMVKTVDN